MEDGVALLWWGWQLLLYVSLWVGAILAMLTQEMEDLGHRVAGLDSSASSLSEPGSQGEKSKLVTAPAA